MNADEKKKRNFFSQTNAATTYRYVVVMVDQYDSSTIDTCINDQFRFSLQLSPGDHISGSGGKMKVNIMDPRSFLFCFVYKQGAVERRQSWHELQGHDIDSRTH